MDPSQSSALRILFERLEDLLDRLDIGQQVLIDRTDRLDARLERIELRARKADEDRRAADIPRRR
jgi:ribosome assembly protein YihI (activator of Der GTPase)